MKGIPRSCPSSVHDNVLIGDMMVPMDKLSNIFNKKPDLVVSLC